MRPKTAVSIEQASSYGVLYDPNDPDYSPAIDIFYTTEVQLQDSETEEGKKMINEFRVEKTIGTGSYSKVRLVTRCFVDEEGKQSED